jgi:hypothetical protein
MVGKDFIPHQLGLTQAQINKLVEGKPVNIQHGKMGAGAGDIVIHLKPQNARKLLTAYKKGKGMRLTMHPHEIDTSLKHGSGFFQTLKKYTGIGKTQFLGGAKKIGKKVIADGATVAGTAIGAYMGNPMAGAMIGQALGKAGEKAVDSIQPSKGKLGIKFDPREGVKSLKEDAKMYAVEAIDRQIDKLPPQYRDVAQNALAGKYPDAESLIYDVGSASFKDMGGYGVRRPAKGSAEMREKMARLRAMKGGKIDIGKAFKKLGKDIDKGFKKEIARPFMRDVGKPTAKAFTSKEAMDTYKAIGKHAIEQGIPVATALASMAMGDPTGMSGAVVGNVAQQYASKEYDKAVGSGVRRGRGRPRKIIGGDVASMSAPYKQALRLNYGGLTLNNVSSSNDAVSNFNVNSRVRPSASEMTLSPYARMDSPAMNPFIPTYYRQQGGTSCGYGGKGLYGHGLYG